MGSRATSCASPELANQPPAICCRQPVGQAVCRPTPARSGQGKARRRLGDCRQASRAKTCLPCRASACHATLDRTCRATPRHTKHLRRALAPYHHPSRSRGETPLAAATPTTPSREDDAAPARQSYVVPRRPSVEKLVQALHLAVRLELDQRLGLDLADALAGDAERLADLFERARMAVRRGRSAARGRGARDA